MNEVNNVPPKFSFLRPLPPLAFGSIFLLEFAFSLPYTLPIKKESLYLLNMLGHFKAGTDSSHPRLLQVLGQ